MCKPRKFDNEQRTTAYRKGCVFSFEYVANRNIDIVEVNKELFPALFEPFLAVSRSCLLVWSRLNEIVSI